MGWSGWSSTTQNGVLTIYYSALDITADDFEMTIAGGVASLSNSTPSSITVSGTSVKLGLPLEGIPDGNETLSVFAKANSIYDTAGNVASSSAVSFTLYDRTPSVISTITLTEVNTQVLVSFSEPINTYASFRNGEPNDLGGNENYGILTGGEINDESSSAPFPSLVETDSNRTTLGDLTHIGTYNGHSYFKLNTAYTWQDAKIAVDAIDGYLAIINTESELFFIKNQSPGEVWIGLYQDTNDTNYSEPSGGWKWVDGSYASMGEFNLDAIELSISGGTASLTATIPVSIEHSGLGGVGSSQSILVKLPLSGKVSGEEILTVGIVSNSLTGTDGNVLSATQTNNSVQLVDRNAPTVLLTDDRLDDIFKDGDTVLITATFDEAMTESPHVIFSNSNSSYPMTASNSASVWNYSWVVSGTMNESITVTLEGTDLLGNSYSGTDTLSYEIDNSTPTVIFSDDRDNRLLRASDTVLIEASFSESLASTPTIILSDGVLTSTVSLTGSLSGSTWKYSWDVGAMDWADGELSVQIQDATDQGGNAYSGSSSLTFIIDNTAPTLQLSSNRSSGIVKTGDEVVFEALISEAVTNPPILTFGGVFSNQLMNQTASPTVWVYEWIVPETIQESFSATASVTDDAGNNQSTANTLTLALDNTAAVISEITILPDNTAVEVTFDDAVYTSFSSGVASGSLEVSDFGLEVSGGKATLLSAVPEGLTFNNNTYTLYFTTVGAATGSETLNIKVNSNSIFD